VATGPVASPHAGRGTRATTRSTSWI
jgi:hypothetical protein